MKRFIFQQLSGRVSEWIVKGAELTEAVNAVANEFKLTPDQKVDWMQYMHLVGVKHHSYRPGQPVVISAST